jgi:hypothetical protein
LKGVGRCGSRSDLRVRGRDLRGASVTMQARCLSGICPDLGQVERWPAIPDKRLCDFAALQRRTACFARRRNVEINDE